MLGLQELLVGTMIALLWEVSEEHRMFVQSQAVRGLRQFWKKLMEA